MLMSGLNDDGLAYAGVERKIGRRERDIMLPVVHDERQNAVQSCTFELHPRGVCGSVLLRGINGWSDEV